MYRIFGQLIKKAAGKSQFWSKEGKRLLEAGRKAPKFSGSKPLR